METNSAIDNLWYLTDDVLPQVVKTGKPKTLSANPEKIYISRTTKMVGTMVYFLPKDASGKIVGAPKKFLQLKGTKYNDNLLDASKVIPYYQYVASNPTKFNASAVSLAQSKINNTVAFTGLDDIRNSMSKYGANGSIDLSNIDGIDESIANCMGMEMDLGFTGSSGYSDADGDTEYSNTIGDWFKGVFGKKDKDSALNKIADPDVALVDANTMDKAYKESGSGTTFKEWISSDKGRNLIDSVTKFASVFINTTNPKDLGKVGDGSVGSGSGSGSGSSGSGSGDGKPSETKILGMSPITFGIVAFAVIAVGSIVAIKVLKNK